MVHYHVYADPSAVQTMDIITADSDNDIVRPGVHKLERRGRETLVLVRKRPKMVKNTRKQRPGRTVKSTQERTGQHKGQVRSYLTRNSEV